MKQPKYRFILTLIILSYSNSALGFDILQALPSTPITPKSNPTTSEKVELGKQLFFDSRLSFDGSLSCNSCHNLSAGGDDDGRINVLSNGQLKRSAPTLWNVGYLSVNYWDSRATSLEAQAKEHILDPRVMNMRSALQVTQRIKAIPGYRKKFNQVFKQQDSVSLENIAKAISSFERTLNTPNSPFDQYIKGNKKALNASALKGLELFHEVECMSCHFGVNFAGPAPGPALKMGDAFYELFPNHLGSHYEKVYKLADDLGLYKLTFEAGHKHLFRVAPLRNIALTAPYFHNGSVSTLEEAIRIMAFVQLKQKLSDEQVRHLVSFLNSLTGEFPQISLPRLPDTAGTTLSNK